MKTTLVSFTALSTTTASLIRSLSGVIASLCLAALPVSAQKTEDPPCISPNGKRNDCVTIESVTQSSIDRQKFIATFKATKQNGRSLRQIDPSQISISFNNGKSYTQEPIGELTPREPRKIPIRAIILLDYSGSMLESDQSSRITKIEGAVNSIRQFIRLFRQNQDADVKLSVVPFAIFSNVEGKCPNKEFINNGLLFNEGDTAKNNNLLNRFYKPDEAGLDTLITNLGNKDNLCRDSSTNLYQAIMIGMDFLAQKDNRDLYPKDQKQQPKLLLIVLSDGFNTEPLYYTSEPPKLPEACEINKRDFPILKQNYLTSSRYSEITIHTIGYGREDKKNFNCEDVFWGTREETLPPGKIRQSEYVDTKSLNEIAQLRGGFSDLQGTSEGLDAIFREIYESIVSGYELTFTDSQADVAEARSIKLKLEIGEKTLTATYPFSVPVYSPVSLKERLPLLGTSLVSFVVLGFVPFLFWRNSIKRSEQDE